jgi:predicted enzyme related to lactoylglutathione lyase
MNMLKNAMCLAAGFGLLSATVSLAQQAGTEGEKLEVGHIHLGVKDIPSALAWFEKVFHWKPVYHDERMAMLALKPMGIILDKSENDAVATLGFQSKDVDKDYQRLVGRGAVSLEAPNDKPYGVRGAYIKGPGSLKIELEGPLKNPKQKAPSGPSSHTGLARFQWTRVLGGCVDRTPPSPVNVSEMPR